MQINRNKNGSFSKYLPVRAIKDDEYHFLKEKSPPAFELFFIIFMFKFLNSNLTQVLVFLVTRAGPAFSQAVIQSLPQGGPWQLGSTWVGGNVPAATDHVVINGPVTFCYGSTWNSVSAASLTINSCSSLTGCGRILVSGAITNQGSI